MNGALVTGVGFWSPERPSALCWAEGRLEPGADKPACLALPSRAKRGTSLVTRMAVEVAQQAATQGGCALSATATIFGSALGEVGTAIDQMAMIASEDGLLSPTRFKNSVHNTATGLLSIAAENRGYCTAIAAGTSTVAMCLLEAMALLETEATSVVVALADESVPGPFQTGREYDPLAIGFCLRAEAPEGEALALLSSLERRSPGLGVALPERLAKNPVAAAIPLLEAILGGRAGAVPLELEGDEPYGVEVGPTRSS